MRQMYKNRLLKLAAFLRTVPRKHFNLNEFTNVEDEDNIKCLIKIGTTLKPLDCGTTTCAIGWCPSVFPRNFIWNNHRNIELINKYNETGWLACEKFFKLNTREAYYLFSPEYYRIGHHGPKSVASRIEKFVKDGKISTKQYINF